MKSRNTLQEITEYTNDMFTRQDVGVMDVGGDAVCGLVDVWNDLLHKESWEVGVGFLDDVEVSLLMWR